MRADGVTRGERTRGSLDSGRLSCGVYATIYPDVAADPAPPGDAVGEWRKPHQGIRVRVATPASTASDEPARSPGPSRLDGSSRPRCASPRCYHGVTQAAWHCRERTRGRGAHGLWTVIVWRLCYHLPRCVALSKAQSPHPAPGCNPGTLRRMAKAPPWEFGGACNTCEYLPLRRMSAARSPGPFRGAASHWRSRRRPRWASDLRHSVTIQRPVNSSLSSSPESGEGGRPLRRSGGRSRTCCRC